MPITKGKKPHVLALPFPVQGHITPLIKLSRLIATHGIKVTFVNTEFIHQKFLSSMSDQDKEQDNIVLTSIPDGLPPQDVRRDSFTLFESLKNTAGEFLTDLIGKINESNSDEKISCVIADVTIGWVLEIVEKLGVEGVVFGPSAAASLAMILHMPKLVEEGGIDENGTVTGTEIISLSDNLPPWTKDELPWTFPMDLNTQKVFFENFLILEKAACRAKWLLCNTSDELESSACDLIPNLLPIGPLLKTNINSKFSSNASSLYREDTTYLSWLDEKAAGSVIYVAFGSCAVFSQHQLDELALGLELSGRPFLWVVRPDLANGSPVEFPDGFLERVSHSGIGKIVEWAPQEKVLSHRSIGCFLSHCGWNSTMEGLSMGVPFLCWPYFADQLHNQKYICDKWRIGLRIDPDGNGMRSRIEVKKKIEMLFCDDSLRVNALRFKKMARKSVDQGGTSYKNFEKFIDHLKE